jgi:ArsR family transcriptional regulator, lead/cadmium/zinc/bismuth-responsive transcriptional repressor
METMTVRLQPSQSDGGSLAAAGDSCPVRVLHREAISRAQTTLRPDEDYAILAETFRALGDASRAKILHALMSGELCVCDLAALIGISDSAISQHLRILRGLRIVRNRKVGRVVYYSLEDACIRALLAVGLTHVDDPTGGTTPAGDDAVEPGRARRRAPGHHHHRTIPVAGTATAEHGGQTDQT